MSDEKPKLRKIIEKMDRLVRDSGKATRADSILLLMLKRWEDEIPEYNEVFFHKQFRQTDVVDNENGQGEMDMVIWHLLHESSLFWEAAAPRDTETGPCG